MGLIVQDLPNKFSRLGDTNYSAILTNRCLKEMKYQVLKKPNPGIWAFSVRMEIRFRMLVFFLHKIKSFMHPGKLK